MERKMVNKNKEQIYLNKIKIGSNYPIKVDYIYEGTSKYGPIVGLNGMLMTENEMGVMEELKEVCLWFGADTKCNFGKELIIDICKRNKDNLITFNAVTRQGENGKIYKNYMVAEVGEVKNDIKKVELQPKLIPKKNELTLTAEEQDLIKQAKDGGYTKDDLDTLINYFSQINVRNERAKEIINKYL